ncbi:MAG: protein kinase [Phycisphaerae bacterium]
MANTTDNPSPSDERSGSSTPESTGTGENFTLLGDFELHRVIGRGGMGTVYEAFQRSLQRTVAVKILDRQVSSSQTAVVRFQREAQAAAKLRHPHIVPIIALGEQGGVNYYAMELINGSSLNDLIAENRARHEADTATVDLAETVPLPRSSKGTDRATDSSAATPPSRSSTASGSTVTLPPSASVQTSAEFFHSVAEHMSETADALEYAHAHGVIHRDIKPHNLLLDNDGRMWISDFGLARLAEQPGVTITGELLGSPLYMSPEQIKSDPAKVDHRTDIYSLGATMYEWLAMTPPYPGETREQVISTILSSEPLPLRAHNPAIPVDLETICLKAIEREPNRRYQTAGDLRDDLRRFLANQPIKVKRASLPARAVKLISRHQVASIAVAAVLVLAVLTWALVGTKGRLEQQTAEIEQARADAEQLSRILDVFNDAPLEVQGAAELGAGVIDAAGSLLTGVSEAGRAMRTGTASPPSTGADPAAAGTAKGITRRVAREYFEAVVPDNWPAPPESRQDVPALLRLALENWADEPADAFELIDGYLGKHPGDQQAVQMRAALGARLGRDADALADSRDIVTLSPRDPHAYMWRAMGLLLHGDTDGCVADLDQAGELGAPAEWVGILRGLAMTQANEAMNAIYPFDAVLDSTPDRVVALLGRASARASLGDITGAITDLTRVIELEPENAHCIALRGDRYMELEDFNAAGEDYQEAMRLGGRSYSMVVRYMTALSRQRAERDQPESIERTGDQPNAARAAETSTDEGGPSSDASGGRWRDWIRRNLRRPAPDPPRRVGVSVPALVRAIAGLRP